MSYRLQAKHGRDSDSDEDERARSRKRARHGYDVGARYRAPPPMEDQEDFYDRFNRGYYDDDDDSKGRERKAFEPMLARDEESHAAIPSQGPGRRVMQQAVIVTTVQSFKEEIERRLRQNPDDWIVPDSLAAGQDQLLRGQPGDIGMEYCDAIVSDMTHRSQYGTFGSRQVFWSANGLSRKRKVKFAGVLAQPVADMTKRNGGDDAHTLEEGGSTTVTNTGPNPIEFGQEVIADEVPYYRIGSDGRPQAVVQVHGVPVHKLPFATYGLRTNDLSQALAMAREEVNVICKDHSNDGKAAWAAFERRFKEIEAMHGRLQSLRSYAAYYMCLRCGDLGDFIDDICKIMQQDMEGPDCEASDHVAAFGAVAGTPDYELFKKAWSSAPHDMSTVMEVLARRQVAALQIFMDGINRRYVGKCIKGAKSGGAMNVMLRQGGLVF
jgi:hypothetical protein